MPWSAPPARQNHPVNLLMRFYEINGGTLKVDGHPIDTVTRDSLRGNLGYGLAGNLA